MDLLLGSTVGQSTVGITAGITAGITGAYTVEITWPTLNFIIVLELY